MVAFWSSHKTYFVYGVAFPSGGANNTVDDVGWQERRWTRNGSTGTREHCSPLCDLYIPNPLCLQSWQDPSHWPHFVLASFPQSLRIIDESRMRLWFSTTSTPVFSFFSWCPFWKIKECNRCAATARSRREWCSYLIQCSHRKDFNSLCWLLCNTH